MKEREIGTVVHYFDKAMVAVVKLDGSLTIGDQVKFVYHDQEFNEMVDSMEVEHHKIQQAKAGDEVAIKTIAKTHEHAHVYRLE